MNSAAKHNKNTPRMKLIWLLCVLAVITLWYQEKTKRIPEYGTLFYAMGANCIGDCQPDERLRYFQKAVHHDENLAKAHYQIALLYEQMDRPSEAIKAFIRVTQLDPYNGLAHYRVGVHYYNNGDHGTAKKYFLQADSKPDCPADVVFYLAKIFDLAKEYDAAILYYKGTALRLYDHADIVYPRLIQIYHFNRLNRSIDSYIKQLRGEERFELADKLEQYYGLYKHGEIAESEE